MAGDLNEHGPPNQCEVNAKTTYEKAAASPCTQQTHSSTAACASVSNAAGPLRRPAHMYVHAYLYLDSV